MIFQRRVYWGLRVKISKWRSDRNYSLRIRIYAWVGHRTVRTLVTTRGLHGMRCPSVRTVKSGLKTGPVVMTRYIGIKSIPGPILSTRVDLWSLVSASLIYDSTVVI